MSKLIRDKIPEIIKAKGNTCDVYVAEEAEYRERLAAKLREEVEEFLEEEAIEELADVLEVVHALVRAQGSTLEELEAIRSQKKHERGGFEKRLVLKQ